MAFTVDDCHLGRLPDCFNQQWESVGDQAAKEAATHPSPTVGPESILKVLLALELPPSLRYTKEEDQWALNEGGIKEKEG